MKRMIRNLKMFGLQKKRRKLVNGLKWLMETYPDHPDITKMTDQLQQVNTDISELKNQLEAIGRGEEVDDID